MGLAGAQKKWTTEEVAAIWTERAQGLSIAEVARRRGCSVSAISYHLMQVRRARRQLMKQEEEHDARTAPDDTTIDRDMTS